MRKFGLIGYPLGHSFSKKYFAEKFAREKIIDCSYENFPIETIRKFPELLKSNPDLCGINVTIPYKTQILEFVDITDSVVDEIGAANVLKIKRENGKITISGFNSDVTGIRDSIPESMKGKSKNALILGTGGSSRAVSWTLKNLGFEITIVSRKSKPGVLTFNALGPEILGVTDLIINTTPLGMSPDITSKPDLDYNLLNERHTLFDLVYNPEITAFLKTGKERGCKIITGIKMLHSQADRSWDIWNDSDL
jgi:shikimate dehydrogenase